MNTQLTPNPKCSSCLCYWKPTETDFKSSGLPYKTCIKCREIAQAYRDNKDCFIEVIECPCGSCVCRDGMKKHIKTLKHKEFELFCLKIDHLFFLDGGPPFFTRSYVSNSSE
jgi:hypothetical protein